MSPHGIVQMLCWIVFIFYLFFPNAPCARQPLYHFDIEERQPHKKNGPDFYRDRQPNLRSKHVMSNVTSVWHNIYRQRQQKCQPVFLEKRFLLREVFYLQRNMAFPAQDRDDIVRYIPLFFSLTATEASVANTLAWAWPSRQAGNRQVAISLARVMPFRAKSLGFKEVLVVRS